MTDIIERFVSPSGRPVRVAVFDGEPWFVAKDVCEYFGDTNPRRQVSRLDEDERACRKMHTLGGTQEMTVINEAGLYHLLFLMHPKKARGVNEEQIRKRQERLTAFKRWVTHEVLPSIRKHGAYIVPELAKALREERERRELVEADRDKAVRERLWISSSREAKALSELSIQHGIIRRLKGEVRRLEGELKDKRKENDGLETENNDLKMKIADLEMKLDEAMRKIEELLPDAEAHRRWWKAWGDGMSRWHEGMVDPGQTRLWDDDHELLEEVR